MESFLNHAKTELDVLWGKRKSQDEKTQYLTGEYFKWIQKKTKIISNEKEFSIPSDIQIQRGSVFWIDFGFNIDEEFGGKHPAIVLRKGSRTTIVVPLSTQEPTEEQLQSGIYVPIKKVYGFKDIPRWVNILNTTPISIQRYDFSSKPGNIKGWELDKLNESIKKSGLWR